MKKEEKRGWVAAWIEEFRARRIGVRLVGDGMVTWEWASGWQNHKM